MAKQAGVEWINDYDHLNDLTHEHTDAGGFYDELVNHDAWAGSFRWGNGDAWASDFERDDQGGNDDRWVDAADFVYFTGHGSPWGIYFQGDTGNSPSIHADNFTGTTDGDVRLGDLDLEWLALEVCNVLQMDAAHAGANHDVFDRWQLAFQGMHTMCSFTTVSLDKEEPGRYFAAFCDGRWLREVFGIPLDFDIPLMVIDAWFNMTSMTQPSQYTAAVLYANAPGTDTHNDQIHGHGHVSSNPRRGNDWFSLTWVSQQC